MSEITPDHIWKMIDDIGICMFITWDGERQRARPMAAMPRKDEDCIYFLTGAMSAKDDQIERFPIVTLAFADNGGHDYVAVTGRAAISMDREKIRELWSPMAKAWWDGPDDPEIRLIKVSPEDAEAWDSPGGMAATVKMLTAAMGSGRPDMGDHGKVDL